jgi:hypothetical protein
METNKGITFSSPAQKLQVLHIPFTWAITDTSFLEHAFHLERAKGNILVAVSVCELKAAFPDQLKFNNDQKRRCPKCKEICSHGKAIV